MYLTFIFENLFPFIYNAFLETPVSETGKSQGGGGGLSEAASVYERMRVNSVTSDH